MRGYAVAAVSFLTVAAGALMWGAVLSPWGCLAGVVFSLIVVLSFAAAKREWEERGERGELVLPATDYDPRGKNPRVYLLTVFDSAATRCAIRLGTLGLVAGLAVQQWAAVALGTAGFAALALSAGMAIAFFNAFTAPPASPAETPEDGTT